MSNRAFPASRGLSPFSHFCVVVRDLLAGNGLKQRKNLKIRSRHYTLLSLYPIIVHISFPVCSRSTRDLGTRAAVSHHDRLSLIHTELKTSSLFF